MYDLVMASSMVSVLLDTMLLSARWVVGRRSSKQCFLYNIAREGNLSIDRKADPFRKPTAIYETFNFYQQIKKCSCFRTPVIIIKNEIIKLLLFLFSFGIELTYTRV